MRRILIDMRSEHKQWPRFLSAAVLATVVLCQVIGTLCPMVPPVWGAPASFQSAHAGHAMGGTSMCQDSIPSSFTSFKSFETHSVALVDSVQPTSHSRPTPWTNHPDDSLPAGNGHSLLSRLSTFRI